MYTKIFYFLLLAIIFSLFTKFNPNFFSQLEKNFYELTKNFSTEKKNISDEKKILEEWKKIKIAEKSLDKDFLEKYKIFEERWDFYASQNFIELAINEYNKSILEIEKWENYANKNVKNLQKLWKILNDFLNAKKRILEKLYKNQNLIWDYKKAEKNILNLVAIFPDEKFLFELIRNKMNQKDLEKAQLILNRIKNKNYKYYYFDFIFNLNPNEDVETLEKKFDNVKNLVEKSWDTNYILKVLAINNALEEYKTYRDSPKIHLYTLIAKALTNSFEFEISNKILWEVLKIREDYRDARIIFAYNKIREWEPKKWLNILIWAENIDPTKPDIQFYKAFAYQDLWDLVKAKHNFLIALKNWFEPKSQIYQKLAEISFKEKKYWDAIDFYKKMLGENSEKIEYFLLPFEISVENQKDFKLALKIAQWAQRRHSESALANSIVWYWYFLNWDIENAKNALKKAFELDPNLARNYLYAWEISMKEWNTAIALKQFEIAYKKNPNWKIWKKAIRFYNKLIK